MRKRLLAAGVLLAANLFCNGGSLRAADLVTLSGTTYRDAQPVRVEPDGVTWRYEGGVVKVDFADCPESVRRAYRYDATRAAAYRDAQAQARQRADEQARRDFQQRDARQRARAQQQFAAARAADAADPATAAVFRRAASPAASQATRDLAAQLAAAQAREAAEAADASHLNGVRVVPAIPGTLGPRPINPFMDTPNSAEYRASLAHSAIGGVGQFVPTSEILDERRSSINNGFFNPFYMTRSYYEDTDRAAAFARGIPLKQP